MRSSCNCACNRAIFKSNKQNHDHRLSSSNEHGSAREKQGHERTPIKRRLIRKGKAVRWFTDRSSALTRSTFFNRRPNYNRWHHGHSDNLRISELLLFPDSASSLAFPVQLTDVLLSYPSSRPHNYRAWTGSIRGPNPIIYRVSISFRESIRNSFLRISSPGISFKTLSCCS